ncbi:MAG: endonuclease/exonuclease/phosphatase family protein [Alcanivorax sp.]|nr:endonuclease/exonuclease/phosphatase family protein [Alcanivorax sp.]
MAEPRAMPSAGPTQWSLVTFNAWRLRDTHRDSRWDSPLSRARLDDRLDALADFIRTRLAAPTVLALQEVENRPLLEALRQRLQQRGLHYQMVLREGQDPSGMDVALLLRAPAVAGPVRQLFARQQFAGAPLFSRPPLLVRLRRPWPVTLVVVHLRSARDLSSSRVYRKRQRQAAMLADWVRQQQGALIVLGDFNSGPGNARFSASYQRFADAGLHDVWSRLPPAQRFSYRYHCRPRALDHIWLDDALWRQVSGVMVSRGNAGRYRLLYGYQGSKVVSDHDGLGVQLPLTLSGHGQR